MANNRIKGLTIEIGGDTSKLSDALKDVDSKTRALSSELGDINRLLRLDPSNTELLAQKQKVLADAISNTAKRLETLKEAERQAQEQFERGEISEEQYRALQREVVATEKKLDGYKNAAKETADAIDNLGKETEETEKSSSNLGETLGNAAKVGMAAVAAAATAAIAGLVGAAESTREYRTAMSKLDTAFTMVGHSSEAATGTYQTLQGVLGDTDQAVEASNFLAQLCDDEEQLGTMTEALTGVYAMFGDALPLEGLAEAANESAKTGAVTGSLADALNWASIESTRWAGIIGNTSTKAQAAFNKAVKDGANTEDAFTAALEACANEQERALLITNTLSGAYQEEAWAFQEANAEIIRANEANEAWTASMAGIGGAIEPIITDIKMMGAAILADLVPGVTNLAETFRGLLNGDASPEEFGAALSGMITQLVDKLIAMAPTLIETALSLTTSLLTSLLTSLAENAPAILQAVLDGFNQTVAALSEALPTLLPIIVDAVISIADTLIDNIDMLIDSGIALIMALADGLIAALPRLVEKAPVLIAKLVAAVARNAPKLLQAGIDLVVKLGAGLIQAVPQLVSKIPTLIKSIVSSLSKGLKDVATVGKNLVKGLWNGISDATSWIISKIKGFGTSVMNGIKKIFGIHSPSTEMAWVGKMLDEGLAKGIEDAADAPTDALADLSGDLMGEAESLNGLTLQRQLNHTFAADTSADGASGLLGKLDAILAAIERGQILTIDKTALIGSTADGYDNTLGQRRALVARGAL